MEGGKIERLTVPGHLRGRMLEVAREFRQEPTLTEHLRWQELRRGRLDGLRFRRQQPIGPFVVDFFCARHKLIIEVDGPIHDQQIERSRPTDLTGGVRLPCPEALSIGYRNRL